MTVIHKCCGTELVSSPNVKGDVGYCPKCKKDVHHLVATGRLKNGVPEAGFSDEVEVRM